MFAGRSLRTQLTAMALGATAVTTLLCAGGYWALQQVSDRMGAMQQERVKPIVALGSVAHAIERQRAQVLATLAATNDVMVDELKKRAGDDAVALPRTLEGLRTASTNANERAALDAAAAALARGQDEGLKAVLERLDRGQFVEADVAAQTLYRPRMDEASLAIERAIGLQVQHAADDHAATEAWVVKLGIAALVASTLALMGGLLVSGWMSHALRRILGADERELASGARHIARGDLEHRIPLSSRVGEESVAASLNQMAEGFGAVVAEAAGSARIVAGGAGRLAAGAGDLSERCVRQAASLEQTAASLAQLAATVGENAVRAREAETVAGEAAGIAREGGAAMARVESRMQAIDASSNKVAEILGVIDAITFQTNILALNAAVEAARAGEHGRGFAVVAAEVRSLSQRSDKAAHEVRALVQASRDEARAGSALVADASHTIAAVVECSSRLTTLVQDISRASHEQSRAVSEVGGAVELLYATTQSNARQAERSALDAEELAARAHALLEAIAQFADPSARDETVRAITRAAALAPPTQAALPEPA